LFDDLPSLGTTDLSDGHTVVVNKESIELTVHGSCKPLINGGLIALLRLAAETLYRS
jgi:hypothetical protein